MKTEELWKELLERRRVGMMLSNIVYNLQHRDKITDRDRSVLGACRKEWDAIKPVIGDPEEPIPNHSSIQRQIENWINQTSG